MHIFGTGEETRVPGKTHADHTDGGPRQEPVLSPLPMLQQNSAGRNDNSGPAVGEH